MCQAYEEYSVINIPKVWSKGLYTRKEDGSQEAKSAHGDINQDSRQSMHIVFRGLPFQDLKQRSSTL